MREPPKDLVAFIDENTAKTGSRISLARYLSAHKYNLIMVTESRLYDNSDQLTTFLFRAALKNLQDQNLPKSLYKVTVETKKGGRGQVYRRSRHFDVSLTPEEIAPEVRCEDCKGGGWYVGIVERKPCPTCGGSGVR